jgi:hypothetical protein
MDRIGRGRLMAEKQIESTDPSREVDLGRVALWLDVEDLRWLTTHCACGDSTPEIERERCRRIRFRANAALHKAGLK